MNSEEFGAKFKSVSREIYLVSIIKGVPEGAFSTYLFNNCLLFIVKSIVYFSPNFLKTFKSF